MSARLSRRAVDLRRAIHATVATIAVATFVAVGLWGILLYIAALFALHVKPRSTHASDPNGMQLLLENADARDAAWWRAFAERPCRKTLLLPASLPPWWLMLAGYVPAIALVPVLGAGGMEGASDVAYRLALGVFAIAVLWAGSFGAPRRLGRARALVFGSDGVRLTDDAFLPWYALERAVPRADGSAVDVHRKADAPAVVCTWSLDVAQQVVQALHDGARAASLAAPVTEPVMVSGFRDGVAPSSWPDALRRAASPAERDALLLRIAPSEEPRIRQLAEETADPELEVALRARLR